MRCSILLIAFFSAAAYAETADSRLASGAERGGCALVEACFQGRRYYFENSAKRHRDDAFNFCSAIGMSLVSVDNCEEDAFITNTIKNMSCTHERFWTSGYQNGDRHWYWAGNHKDVGFTNWKTGEPNYNRNNENCLEYTNDFLQWNDAPCDHKLLLVCESNEAC